MEAEGVTRRVNSLGSALGGLAAFSGLSGIGVSVASAVDKFGQFETALVDMGKVSDRDLGAIRADIEAINPVLGSSTELMRGYYQTISAGVTDPVKSVEMLTVASRASQAAHVTQSETIKALTKVMAGYGDEISTATEASDLLFAIERQGQTSFSELVPVIGDLANISNEAAVSTSEMGASMALLTQTSGSTAEAATKYKAMLVNLLKPTTAMSEALTALGYESGNALIADKGVVSSLKLLKQYADSAGVGVSSLFESSEAFMGVSALLAEDGRKLADNINAIGSAAGSTDKAFEKWSKTSEAIRKKFDSVWSNSMKTFGEAFAPEFNKGLDSISTWLTEHNEDIKDWAEDSGEAIGKLSKKVSGLYDFYSGLPEEITGVAGAGILGRMLFGSWGMGGLLAAMTGFGEIVGQAKSVANDLGEKGSFTEGFNKQFYKIFGFLGLDGGVYDANWGGDTVRKMRKQLIEEGKKIDPSQSADFWTGDFSTSLASRASDKFAVPSGALDLNLFPSTDVDMGVSAEQELRNRLNWASSRSVNRAFEAANERAKLREKEAKNIKSTGTGNSKVVPGSALTDKEIKARKRAQKDLNKALLKLTSEPYEFEKKQIKAQKAAWEKAEVDHVELVEWETYALREIDEKYNAEKLRKQAEFNAAFADEFLDPYILEQRAIREQARIYRQDNNKVKVAQWEKSQLAKLEREHTRKVEEENKKRLEEEKQAARERLLAHGDFFDGIALGYEQMLEDQQTWAERGVDIFNDFATSAKSSLSDLGFDALTGQMKSFSDYWDSFWRGMARSVMNHVADLAVNKGIEALVSMGGGLFDMAGTFMSNIFHTGNMRVGADEVAAILQTDEIVIPAKQSEALRQVAGSDGMSKGAFFDNIVDYAVTGKQYSISDRINNSQRDMYGWDMLDVARDSALVGIANAVQNWTTIGRQADFLREQGMDISQSAVDNAQYNYALSGLAGSFFPTFAGNLMGAWGNRALGMNDAAFSLMGFDISSANIGNILGSAAGILLGGPAAPIVSGVLSPVFSMAVSGLADAFDAREHETVRDMLEEKLGAVAGRLAFQSFQNSIHAHPLEEGKYAFGFSLSALTAPEMVAVIMDRMERVHGISSEPNPVSKALASAHQFGHEYTSQMMSGSAVDQAAIAGAIKQDLGFFGYSAREFAARQLGGFEYGDSYYTADGKRVDIDSIQNPNSAIARAYRAAINSGRTFSGSGGSYSLGDFGGLGDVSGGLGGFSGYDGVAGDYDLSDFGHEFDDFAASLGSGRNSGYKSSGSNVSGDGIGTTGGSGNGRGGYSRRHGGPVYAGDSALWQERGLPGEIFMPQTNGFVINHEISEQFIAAVRDLVSARQQRDTVSGSGGGTTVVNIHLDGQQVAQVLVPHLREASENGEQFVHADTLIEAGV